jgi:hypothetical protein
MKNIAIENIGLSERVVRITAGLLLIGSVFVQPGILGATIYLPLIAIYPVITGVVGWDPIVNFLAPRKRRVIRRIAAQAAN